VNHKEIELTERDYYLLGLLVEGIRPRDRRAYRGHLPRGCSDEQAERLVQGGYLYRVALDPNGTGKRGIRYSSTEKGLAAWRAYRFLKA
jgi:hypothetical protein